MAVDRADIAETHLFEERAAHGHATHVFLGPARGLLDVQRLGHAFAQLAQVPVALRGDQPRKIMAHRAHRRRDRHVVIVENDDQAAADMAGIVHRLIGHAGRHRPVTDHRDDIAILMLEVAAHGKAQRRGDRGRGMRSTERIVFALRTLGEAAQPAALAQGADTISTAGQDLVRIALVPDIPDQRVARRIEDVVQCRGQLDHTQPGTQMPTRDRDGVDRLRTQLVGQLAQLVDREIAHVGGVSDLVEGRGGGCHTGPAFHERRSRMKSTASLKTSARAPKGSRWSLACAAKCRERSRAPSTPRMVTKVAFP